MKAKSIRGPGKPSSASEGETATHTSVVPLKKLLGLLDSTDGEQDLRHHLTERSLTSYRAPVSTVKTTKPMRRPSCMSPRRIARATSASCSSARKHVIARSNINLLLAFALYGGFILSRKSHGKSHVFTIESSANLMSGNNLCNVRRLPLHPSICSRPGFGLTTLLAPAGIGTMHRRVETCSSAWHDAQRTGSSRSARCLSALLRQR